MTTRRVVLDAEAVQALLDPQHASRRQVHAALRAAERLKQQVAVAAVTLAEPYRGASRSRALDALLARHVDLVRVHDTDRRLARVVGGLLADAKLGSEQMADAHAAAVAVETGGIVLTADPSDLERLLGRYAHVTVVPLRDSRL